MKIIRHSSLANTCTECRQIVGIHHLVALCYSGEEKQAIIELVNWLREHLADFSVVDHWDADLSAVGISAPHDPKLLAYISNHGRPPGYYFVELEAAPALDSDLPYDVVNTFETVSRDELLKIVSEHIARK